MSRIFYGYWIVIAAFLCVFIQSGCGFFAFSLFVKPLQADLGWSRGSIMAAFTIYFLTLGIASPIVGRFIDCYEVKKVIFLGALMGGLGFVLLSLMPNLWSFYAGYIIIGAGMAAIGYVPASSVVSSWFKKRRGLLIGVMSTGIGLGGFVLAPIIGAYVIPRFGWRVAYLSLGFITWVVILPLALWVIKTKPVDLGLYADGSEIAETIPVSHASSPVSGRQTLKATLASSTFWLIAISFLFNGFSQVGCVQNQVPFLADVGFPLEMAATALAGVALASAVGKFCFGLLCDWISAKYACFIGFLLQLVSIPVLMSIRPESPLAIIWLYAILMGLGIGSWYPTMSMLISSNFGLPAYGTIFGAVIFAFSLGSSVGPLVAGFLYDTFNSYHWSFIIFVTLYAVSIPLILVLPRPKSQPDVRLEDG